jgi:hypothetical protein
VIQALSRAEPSNVELKKKITGSPLLGVLKRKVCELSALDQMRVLATALLLSDVEILHFKLPSSIFADLKPSTVEVLLRHLKAFQGSVLWEDSIEQFEPYFSNKVDLTPTKEPSETPLKLEDLARFETLPFHPFRGTINKSDSGLTLLIGDHHIELEADEYPTILGLVNHELIVCLSDESFEFFRKEKKGCLKLPILHQNKYGLSYHQIYEFETVPFLHRAERRSPVPHVFVRPSLSRLYLFHPKSGARLFPL